jgi:hypothetical protein
MPRTPTEIGPTRTLAILADVLLIHLMDGSVLEEHGIMVLAVAVESELTKNRKQQKGRAGLIALFLVKIFLAKRGDVMKRCPRPKHWFGIPVTGAHHKGASGATVTRRN